MRKWTTSACVALAWSIIMPLLAAAGLAAPAQATTTASITQITLASESATAITATSEDTQAGTREATSAAHKPAATWTVRQGDTLSAIATALTMPGGWQTLYAANRQIIGPNPNAIRPGTILALPRTQAPLRYSVRPGDTLSGIAAALTIPGGWQALYAANRQAIGPNPNAIRPGTVLTAHGEPHQPANHSRHQAAPPAHANNTNNTNSADKPDNAKSPIQPTAMPSHSQSHPQIAPHPTAGGTMPNWLKDILLAAGLLAAIAFAIEPVAALARRRRTAKRFTDKRLTNRRLTDKTPRSHANTRERDPAQEATARAKIVFANYDRLIITYSSKEDTIYILTPPGEDPRAILRAARLILPEHRYQNLADHLGVPSALPLE